MSTPSAFFWKNEPSFATLPENHQFQTKKYKQWVIDRKANPGATPDWETYRDKVNPKYKHYATPAEKSKTALMSPKEIAFNRAMKLLAKRCSAFSTHISTQAESDRTWAIGRAAC